MSRLNKLNISKVLRRIYLGKKPKVGPLQIFRAFNLIGLTLTFIIVPFVPNTSEQPNNLTIVENSEGAGDIPGEQLVASEELLAQAEDIDYRLGPVVSGFTNQEISQFKMVKASLDEYLNYSVSKDVKRLVKTCADLASFEEDFLPIYKRVNPQTVQPKFDKYWGLASTYLYLGNMQCVKISKAADLSLLKDAKIFELYTRSHLYFQKILIESSSQLVPNQEEIDKQQLRDAIADENAYVADVTARAQMYFTKSAGLSDSEIKVLDGYRPLLKSYISSIEGSNLVLAAAACSNISLYYSNLRSLESDSKVYEESLDRVKDYAFEGIDDCKKGFKKNRIIFLVEAAGKFEVSSRYIENLLVAAKNLT
jgi:hypothetical protein